MPKSKQFHRKAARLHGGAAALHADPRVSYAEAERVSCEAWGMTQGLPDAPMPTMGRNDATIADHRRAEAWHDAQLG